MLWSIKDNLSIDHDLVVYMATVSLYLGNNAVVFQDSSTSTTYNVLPRQALLGTLIVLCERMLPLPGLPVMEHERDPDDETNTKQTIPADCSRIILCVVWSFSSNWLA